MFNPNDYISSIGEAHIAQRRSESMLNGFATPIARPNEPLTSIKN